MPKITFSSTRILNIARQTIETEKMALGHLQDSINTNFYESIKMIASIKGRIILSGIGKSGYIANKISATLSSTGTISQYIHPTEASHGDLGIITSKDMIIILSWSGQSPELHNLIVYAKENNIPMIAITANPESIVGKYANICLTLPKIEEACPNGLTPTSSTIMQLALGDAIAISLLQNRGFTATDFKKFHPGGKLGFNLTCVEDIMHKEPFLPLLTADIIMSEALITMTQKGFGCLGIIDENENLIGMITDGDLRRHMDTNFLDKKTYDIMTQNPEIISPTTFVADTLDLMNHKKIQSLFICVERKPKGIIHLHDLLRIGIL